MYVTDTEEDSVVIYKYDKNGNQLATVNRYEIPSDKKDNTYVDIDVTLGDNRLNENVVNHYNALNQLTQTLTKNYKVSFTYNAEGLRTSKTVNGEKTVFVWDGEQLLMELTGSGKVKKRYIRGNDLVYADKGKNTEKQYYVTDPHGNVVQLTDENGAVTKTYEYDSFGNEVKPDVKDDNPFRYCGEYYDKETEEIYLRARYYQPEQGRFLTRDTYTGEADEPESLHLYTYCGNDGVNAWDPSGHRKTTKFEKGEIDKLKKNAPKYNSKLWNDGDEEVEPIELYGPPTGMYILPDDKVQYRTNCYAYAFNYRKNPKTKQEFAPWNNYSIWGMQPGMFSGNMLTNYYKRDILDAVKSDMKILGVKFYKVTRKNKKKYKKVVKKSYIVALVINPGKDYHWYRLNRDGKWSDKPGATWVRKRKKYPTNIKNEYTEFAGYYYVKKP